MITSTTTCSSVASQPLNATDSLVTLLLSHGLSSEVAVARQVLSDKPFGTPGLTTRIVDGGIGRRLCRNILNIISTLDLLRV